MLKIGGFVVVIVSAAIVIVVVAVIVVIAIAIAIVINEVGQLVANGMRSSRRSVRGLYN